MHVDNDLYLEQVYEHIMQGLSYRQIAKQSKELFGIKRGKTWVFSQVQRLKKLKGAEFNQRLEQTTHEGRMRGGMTTSELCALRRAGKGGNSGSCSFSSQRS